MVKGSCSALAGVQVRGGRERENLLGEEVLGNGFQEAARVVLFAHKFYFNQVV